MALRSGKENARQRIDQLAPFGIGQLGKVALFPHDGGQMLRFRYPEKRPIRFASFEADKEPPVIFRHGGAHRSDAGRWVLPCGLCLGSFAFLGYEQQFARRDAAFHISMGFRRIRQRIFAADPNLEVALDKPVEQPGRTGAE